MHDPDGPLQEHPQLRPQPQRTTVPRTGNSNSRCRRLNVSVYFSTVVALYALITLFSWSVHHNNTSLPLQLLQLHPDSYFRGSSSVVTQDPQRPHELKQQPKQQQQQQQQKTASPNSSLTTSSSSPSYTLAGLNCDRWGGPNAELAQKEMVYWRHIPSDESFVSPLKKKKKKKITQKAQEEEEDEGEGKENDEEYYLTFEPDQGGFNNIRMAFETTLALAVSMGRTLVLPAAARMYLINQGKHKKHGHVQQKHFGFNDFFHLQAIHNEHVGVNIISMQEFLEREVMRTTTTTTHPTTGISSIFKHSSDSDSSLSSFPPDNRTDWNGMNPSPLFKWLRRVAKTVVWSPEECLAVIPSRPDDTDALDAFVTAVNQSVFSVRPPIHYEMFVGKPVPVNASALDRLKENLASRNRLCLYDASLQIERVLHIPEGKLAGSTNDNADENARLLIHFYAFVFFQNWQHDLWLKRLMRDHVRYIDEIQCAAARIVAALRTRVRLQQKKTQKQQKQKQEKGEEHHFFDTMHVRRGDFQFESTRVNASTLLESMRRTHFPIKETVYIATDERNKSFFDPLRPHYDIVFLDDFHDVIGPQLNSNFFGMVDILVASRGRYFIGCWFSTFTGYINRLRGYRATLDQYPGHDQGVIPSWYYTPVEKADHMQVYYPVKQSFWAREFPTAWRNIDFGLTVN